MKTFYEQAMKILNDAIASKGSARSLALSAGLQPTTIRRWKNGERSPGLAEISPIMDLVGASIVLPSQNNSKETQEELQAPCADEDTKQALENAKNQVALLEKQVRELTIANQSMLAIARAMAPKLVAENPDTEPPKKVSTGA